MQFNKSAHPRVGVMVDFKRSEISNCAICHLVLSEETLAAASRYRSHAYMIAGY